ncbi:hypothetical protein PMIN03_009890 [Paraphaeosphaeria minitans]
MPASSRKRRAPIADDDDDESTPTQRRQTQVDDDEVDEAEQDHGSGSIAQLSKNLVRYALSCEFSRTPIKRQDIAQKVLGSHSRAFKDVFAAANTHLMDVFGMRMVELPNREKVTLRQKRAAAGSESHAKNSNIWILENILPEKYRSLSVMGPSMTPAPDDGPDLPDLESAYIGLYSTVISLLLLSGGTLSEGKLDRFMKRMNAADTTPIATTDKALTRMAKDGYIVKVKETQGGEELVDYIVGPRGKVEVGKRGVANFARTVYGANVEDLEERLTRSLGLAEDGEANDVDGEAAAAPVLNIERRSGRQQRRGQDPDD